MSNEDIVVRSVVLVVGLCLLAFMLAAVRCAWNDYRSRKRGNAYRARQQALLQQIRDDRDREAARRDRNIRETVRFGSSNHPRHWRHESPPVVPFDDDFGGMMSAFRRQPAVVSDWEAPVKGHGGTFDGGGASSDWSDPDPTPSASTSTVDAD